MEYMAYRHMVGVCFTEEEAKAEAAEVWFCYDTLTLHGSHSDLECNSNSYLSRVGTEVDLNPFKNLTGNWNMSRNR